jgi:secretion/DNA translocation related TadE-like protein
VSERGSVSVLVVAALAALLVVTMGAADVARVVVAASRAQTAADAAALAAAQTMAIPAAGEVPSELARTYADRNGGSLESCECDPGSFEATVVVRVPVGRLFLVGDDRSVTASARAVVDLPTP